LGTDVSSDRHRVPRVGQGEMRRRAERQAGARLR
jgi:hypothetical protein